ncbi:MAG: GNAT family N-acetyltransferase [Bacteroidota bacterium]|nr:GNAT family N-acetyltransferase [Bacteroidota bacterium]
MINIREALPQDMPSVFELIKELAIFEKAEYELENTIENLFKDGFMSNPLFYCIVAENHNGIVGMALCYNRYSTWKGKCLYLEDIIVNENHRNIGVGKQLMNHLIQFAQQNNYPKIQWQVLNWNRDAIRFYESFKADFDDEWINVSLSLKK